MKQPLAIDGREHAFEWTRGGALTCVLDGVAFAADAAELSPGVYSILIGGASYAVRIASIARDDAGANQYDVQVDGRSYRVAMPDPRRWSRGSSVATREGPQRILAPMPGKVVRVLVGEGERVGRGQGLVVVEAMKMQNEIKSSAAGMVKKILVAAGQPVGAGESLLIIE